LEIGIRVRGMSLLNIKEFYGQSLGVTTPWKVTEVSIDSETRQVRVLVECARGVPWVDPETRERAEIKDWQERTWRHLDTCEFETVITANAVKAKMPTNIPLRVTESVTLTTTIPCRTRNSKTAAASRKATTMAATPKMPLLRMELIAYFDCTIITLVRAS